MREAKKRKLEDKAWMLTQIMPVGTPVRYWTGVKEGPGKTGVIDAPFNVFGDTVVGWIDTASGYIAESHIEKA